MTNNTHYSHTHGIFIDCNNFYDPLQYPSFPHYTAIVLEKIRYENNHTLRSEISNTTERNSEIALSVVQNSILILDLRLLNNTGPAQEDSYSLLEFRRSMEAPASLRNITIWNNFGHSSVINSEFNCGKIDHHTFEMSYLNISGNVFNTTLHPW